MSLYFDHAATTEPAASVVRCITEALTIDYANPSSLHRAGLHVERKIEEVRTRIAKELSCTSEEVIFTSGGTEANQLALSGTLKPGDRVLVSPLEHSSITKALEQWAQLGVTVEKIPVDPYGVVSLEALENLLESPCRLLSVQQVNNEIGTFQPLIAIGQLLKRKAKDALFHVDGIQAFGKYPVPLNEAQIDLYAMSAHKINGAKGSGALFIRKGTVVRPMQPGGGQERGLRGGTQNVPGILGFGEALRLWQEHRGEWQAHARTLRDSVQKEIEAVEGAKVLSPATGSDFILNIAFTDCKAEVLLHMLEQKGIYVSSGSACGKGKTSPVLEAIGVGCDYLEGPIRMSFSYTNRLEDAKVLCDELKGGLNMIRMIKRNKR